MKLDPANGLMILFTVFALVAAAAVLPGVPRVSVPFLLVADAAMLVAILRLGAIARGSL